MKKLAIFAVLVAALGFISYRVFEAYRTKSAGSSRSSNFTMRVPLVEAVVASEGTLEDKVLLVGSLRPIAQVEVMSKIAGRIEKVMVDVGDEVKDGQLLAQVEDREVRQQIQQGEASLSVARASIQQREAELANFSRQVLRFKELQEQQLISKQDLEDATTRQQTSEAQLALSKAQYRQSEASLNQLNIYLDNTRSYSPMVGFVSKRFLHPGALVTVNTPILEIVDLRTLRMIVNVIERDIVRVNRGVGADIQVDAFPGRTFEGMVSRVSPMLDPATRTGQVEIRISNPQLMLKAEMFARVVLDLGSRRKGILVPRESLVYRGEQSGVFILNRGNRVTFRPVKAGVTQQDVVEIVDGVRLEDRVVSMGASILKDGDQVRLKAIGSSRDGANP